MAISWFATLGCISAVDASGVRVLYESMSRPTARRRGVALAAAFVLLLSACNWRGPAPTQESIEAELGTFEYATAVVPAQAGFGGGTIYYPTDTSQGRFGGVAIVPGYTAKQSSIAWYGPRLASQGFVVFTIDTLSTLDAPNSRGQQLLAALDYLTTESTVTDRVDAARLAVMGWSMGGGGSLFAARNRPSLRAAIPLAGWAGASNNFSDVTVPTMFISCQNDAIAPNATYSLNFYNQLTEDVRKAYVEIEGGDHYCVTSPNDSVARSALVWLKYFVDGDTRYGPFVCPPPDDEALSQYLSTCPY